jgi:peptidyl-prolyl cis-trans isomerase D
VSEPVRTMFGWHLIKVIDHEEAHRKPLVEVEDTIRSMLAEEKAQDRVNNALDQALEMILSGESLESIAEALNLRVKDSGLFSRNQGGSLLGLDQDSLESVFAMAQGEISDRPLSVDQGYMLATVTEKKDAASRPLDEVREQVVEQLTRNKGAELAKEKAAAVAEQMREERGLPEDYRDALETSDPFGRQGSIPGLGMNPELVTAAFGVNPGDWILKPFQVSNGYVLARVLERTPPEDARWQEERDMWLGFLRQQKEREVFQSYLQTLQQQAEIRLVNAQALEQ